MSWTHPAYEAVTRVLGARTGLSFAPPRCDSAELGIRRAMARAKVADPDRYRALIETDDAVLDDLIVELTVGETYFFREPGQFEFLRREVLPEIRRRRGADHVLRAWSAGCASGEEAYSLAILFKEEGLGERAHVLATDISRAALARARTAAYSAWSLRGDGADTARQHLQRHGDRYVLDETLRRWVAFEHLNLALDVYPSFASGTWGMDLVLCRNVLIYFDRDTIAGVARRLFESLAPGGWLLTASSDPPLGSLAPYETVVTSAGVFYRRGEGPGVKFLDPALAAASLATRAVPDMPAPAAPLLAPFPDGTAATAALRPGETPAEPLAAESRPPRRTIAGSRQPRDRETVHPALTEAPPAKAEPASLLVEAQQAFARGEYGRAATLTRGATADAAACALHVRALANLDTAEAERACVATAGRHPLSTELHYLYAVLLMEMGHEDKAVEAARRVLYLDRSLAIAHFTLGSILRRRGDLAGAKRAYRNARALCAARPPDEVVPLSDGEHAGRLAEAAAVQLAVLDATGEEKS